MDDNRKRKADASHGRSGAKKSKPWMVVKKGQHHQSPPSIEPGDEGIWATCEMGKEGKCTSDLRDLFEEYAALLYGEVKGEGEDAGDDDNAEVDIEAEIKKEVQGMKSKTTKTGPLFQTIKMDIQCVLFFKTRAPIEPVGFVHKICKDAVEGATRKHRWVKKLTPMTMMGKATVEGLERVAKDVLEPVFHAEGTLPKKFAIRPTRRNHNVMKRDDIIKQIAKTVGGKHSVDLKNYDHLILVDVYRVRRKHPPTPYSAFLPYSFRSEAKLTNLCVSKNVLGMSVVGSDFEELKQFNLAEIYDPTPKPAGKSSNAKAEAEIGDGQRRANTSSPEPQLVQSVGVITNHLASADKESTPTETE